jgi:hypothetical protein
VGPNKFVIASRPDKDDKKPSTCLYLFYDDLSFPWTPSREDIFSDQWEFFDG